MRMENHRLAEYERKRSPRGHKIVRSDHERRPRGIRKTLRDMALLDEGAGDLDRLRTRLERQVQRKTLKSWRYDVVCSMRKGIEPEIERLEAAMEDYPEGVAKEYLRDRLALLEEDMATHRLLAYCITSELTKYPNGENGPDPWDKVDLWGWAYE